MFLRIFLECAKLEKWGKLLLADAPGCPHSRSSTMEAPSQPVPYYGSTFTAGPLLLKHLHGQSSKLAKNSLIWSKGPRYYFDICLLSRIFQVTTREGVSEGRQESESPEERDGGQYARGTGPTGELTRRTATLTCRRIQTTITM